MALDGAQPRLPPCSPPASSRPAAPGSRSAPRAGLLLPPTSTPGVTDNTLRGVQQAAGAPDTQNEGGRGSFLVALLFPSILDRGRTGAFPVPGSTSDHLPPRMASAGRLSPVQRSPAATRPAPVHPAGRAGTPGLVVSALGARVRGWVGEEAGRAGEGRDRAGELRR